MMATNQGNRDAGAGDSHESSRLRASQTPQRFIFSDSDMQNFLESPAKKELLQATAAMGRACASNEGSYEYDPSEPLVGLSPSLAALVGSLTEMTTWINDFPPMDRSLARFGNPAFRHWHDRLVHRSASIVRCVLNQQGWQCGDSQTEYDLSTLKKSASEGAQAATLDVDSDSENVEVDRGVLSELCAYFNSAFGHPARLDFGTGHECSFQVFLYSLLKLGCFGSTKDEPPKISRLRASTISLYSSYLLVTRQLQTSYMLEPAGSHGVWGLDDYHCLPFYFGACQLEAQDEYNPSCIHSDSILDREGCRYLYLGCIKYIKGIKRGVPFFESSPMLNDISQLATWRKVASGLLRLFEGEVLGKRQVVQHFVFGNIFAANWTPSETYPSPPPTETFRSASVGPHTRAPWSGDEGPRLDDPLTLTRAPWASKASSPQRHDAGRHARG
jgi:hypothetical protein